MMPRVHCLALALLLGAAGCGKGSAAKGSSAQDELGPIDAALDEPTGPFPGAGSASPGGVPLRRQWRHYYVADVGERCTLFWEEGEQRSEPQPTPCPREVQAGERIRLSDRVCMRESGDSSRQQPVRCPAVMVNRDKADRLDAGLDP
jgi:hypothetical protein